MIDKILGNHFDFHPKILDTDACLLFEADRVSSHCQSGPHRWDVDVLWALKYDNKRNDNIVINSNNRVSPFYSEHTHTLLYAPPIYIYTYIYI